MSFLDKFKSGVRTEEEPEEEQFAPEEPPPAKKIRVQEAQAPEARQERSAKEEEDWFEAEGELAVDVYQEEGGDFIIQAAIAGVGANDLDISVEGDVVTISGERKSPNKQEGARHFAQECYWGPFSRQVILPEEIDAERAKASVAEGIFTLRLPTIKRQHVRKIAVQS